MHIVAHYKSQNRITHKQARVSHDVVFDESASWYLPPTPDPNSNPSSDDEVSEAKMPPDEREIGTLDESPISFRLSGPNECLRQFDQSDEESVSSGDSVVHSPCRKPRKRLTCKGKGKKKMPEYGTDRGESDRSESDSENNDEGPSRVKSVFPKKALTSANEQLRRSIHRKATQKQGRTRLVCRNGGRDAHMGRE